MDDAPASPTPIEQDKSGTNARTDVEAAIGTLQESGEQQRFLLKLSDALRPLAHAAEIQATTTRMIGDHLAVDRAMYAEVAGERGFEVGTIRGQYVRPADAGGSSLVPFPEHFTFEPFGAEVMARRYSGEGLVVADVEMDPAFDAAERAAWAAAGVRAAIVAPLVKNGRLVAEFGLHAAAARAWTRAEVSLLREVAERTWAAAERARAEAALRQSEVKYRTLFETMGQGYCELELVRNGDGRAVDQLYLELNPAFERLFGIRGAEAKGRRASEVFPSVDPLWTEAFDRVAKAGTPERFENQHGLRGRWFETFAYPAGGDRVVVFYEDVTDRKRAEAALHESGQRQAFLLMLSDRLRVEVEPRTIAETSVSLLAEQVCLDRVYVAEVDKGRDLAKIGPEYRRSDLDPVAGVLTLSDFPEAWARVEAATLVLADTAADPTLSEEDKRSFAALRMGALMVASARKGTRNPVWALLVASEQPRQWTSAEVALVEETAERTWAAIERARAEKALRESEERLQSALAISTVGVLFWGPDYRLTQVNDAFLRFTGFTREEAIGKSWEELTAPEFHALSERCLEELRETGEGTPYEKQYYRKDGSRWWGLVASRGLGERESVEFVIDVSERRRAEEALRESERHAKMLLAELQHRVRNIMAMIRSVARRTGDTALTVEDYVQHLEGRISAMARTQALLTRDVSATVDLQSLILDELTMQAAHPGQYRVTGPDISLPPKAAEVLGLAVHELATNAVKYGALSESGRRVDIRWALLEGEDAPQLSLIWSEFGVRIDSEPSRRGFGTELITQRVPYELQGTGTMEFRPTGLVATLEFPLAGLPSILQTDEGRPATP